MGEVYGELELKEFISVKDYLDSPVMLDEFLSGVSKGVETVQKRKQADREKLERQNKGKIPTEGIDLADKHLR